jgi:NAD(P)-dependent dehydrogenase (short-subunit alcohol dehydrogenase family)
VLVTGGASGIGAACALAFAAADATVVIADRDEAGAKRLAARWTAPLAAASPWPPPWT